MQKLLRILVVDDENIFQTTLKNLLHWEEHGYILVGFAKNGQEALFLIDHVQPHIIITDIAMPIMNGIDLTSIINEKYPQIGVIVISGFDEFNYVRSSLRYGALDYILKSELNKENILHSLNKLSSFITIRKDEEFSLHKHQFLYHFISDYYTSRDFIEKQFTYFHIHLNLNHPLFICKGFDISKTLDKNKIEILYKELSTQLEYKDRYVTFIYNNTFFIIGNESEYPFIVHLLQNIFQSSNTFIWAISDTFLYSESCKDILLSLTQIEKQYFYNTSSIIYYYDSSYLLESSLSIPLDSLDKQTNIFSFEGLKELLINYLNICSNNPKQDPYYVKKNCEHAIYTIIYHLEKHNVSLNNIDELKLIHFRLIETVTSINELKEIIIQILSNIESTITLQPTQDVILMQQIDEFLETHYHQEIKLSDLAEYVHLTYSYVSKIFKKFYGENFNDYLNKVRIDAAKKLLSSTDESISVISQHVGFCDQSYFSKIFKKTLGVSPKTYRRRTGYIQQKNILDIKKISNH